MTNKKKGSVLIAIAALATLAGLAIYLVSSYTGYLAASAADRKPVLFSVLALVLLAAIYSGKLPGLYSDIALWSAAVLVIASFALFALSRVPLAANIYFIPVNYPVAEETAFNISLAGIIAYVISILALILEGFFGKEK